MSKENFVDISGELFFDALINAIANDSNKLLARHLVLFLKNILIESIKEQENQQSGYWKDKKASQLAEYFINLKMR